VLDAVDAWQDAMPALREPHDDATPLKRRHRFGWIEYAMLAAFVLVLCGMVVVGVWGPG
jgi:hypothetical protein